MTAGRRLGGVKQDRVADTSPMATNHPFGGSRPSTAMAALARSKAHALAGGRPMGPTESRRLLEWLERATVDAALVDLVLGGRAVVRWPDEHGRPTFATYKAPA